MLHLIRTRSNASTIFRPDRDKTHISAKPWSKEPLPWGGHGIDQYRATSTMEYGGGEVEGISYASYIVTYHPESAPEPHESGWFDGHETFVGSVAGNQGTFVIRSSGTIRKGKVTGEWTVLEGTGRDGLVGIRGTGWYKYRFKEAEMGVKGKGGMEVEFDEDKTHL